MRWLLSAVLLLLAAPVFGQENEAEKLFRAMEKKICDAKSLKVVCDVKNSRVPDGMIAECQMAQGNKLRLEFAPRNKTALSFLTVCDGKTIKWQAPVRDVGEGEIATVKHLSRIISVGLGRGPVGNLAFVSTQIERRTTSDFDSEKDFAVKDFKLAGKEQIGKREAHVIEYELTTREMNEICKAKVWIDSKSFLPIKRQFTLEGKEQTTVSEDFVEFLVNLQLDAKLFELPN
jgi:outer membrane lipoprotein-sorting protein